MNFRFDKAGAGGTLIFEGDMSAKNVDCIKEALMVSLNNTDLVVVDLTKVKFMDSKCMQLFCTACKTSMRSGKQLMITGVRKGIFGPLPDESGTNRVDSHATKCTTMRASCGFGRIGAAEPAGRIRH